jgi:hypothetical protein
VGGQGIKFEIRIGRLWPGARDWGFFFFWISGLSGVPGEEGLFILNLNGGYS